MNSYYGALKHFIEILHDLKVFKQPTGEKMRSLYIKKIIACNIFAVYFF